MGNRSLHRPFCYQRYLTSLTGKIVLASGGAITGTPTGTGYSVVRTSAGLYTWTLDDQFPEVQNWQAWLVETAVTTLIGKPLLNYTTVQTQKAGTAQFQITTNAAVAADVAAIAEIHFRFEFRNTSLTR